MELGGKSPGVMRVLMEWLDSDYVTELHSGGLNPYSQHLEKKEETWHWIINLFSEEAYERIYPKIINQTKIYIRHDDMEIGISDKSVQTIDLDELMNHYYFNKSPRNITIRFKTPTAFKQKGKYIFYPDIRCILQSMILKYDAVTVKEGMVQEEMLEELVSGTNIVKYHLRSCTFQMEGVKIPAFTGEIKLTFHGSQTLVNYIQFLFRFACYSGIGIKASVGMGAIEIQEKGI